MDEIVNAAPSQASIDRVMEGRERMARLTSAMLSMDQIDIPIKHTFAPGMYVREMVMPKGSLIVGKIHKHDHIIIVSSGDCTVYSKDGLQRLKGPCTATYTAGTQRAIYAHEDTIWHNIHAVESDDIAEVEDYLVTDEYTDNEWLIAAAKQLEGA